MDNQVEEIKSKIDIVEFIGAYTTVKKSGRNYKALCPFHQEKSPSFVISPDRQIWHCFGTCGDGGDVIKFLMKWEGITFIEALRELAEKAGVRLHDVTIVDKAFDTRDRIFKMNYLASEFFAYVLRETKIAAHARDYLKNRTINDKTIKTFGLGYAPDSWDSLLTFLKKKKYTEGEIFDAGLTVKSDRGGYYDRFRGRIMFPIHDTRGNILGFSGRVLNSDDNTAKYVNSPETAVYKKRETLYGIYFAKDAIRKANHAILVEGEFDMILPHQYGFQNIVAIKGSAVTREQMTLLKRYTNKISLALDADSAGDEAIKRGIEEAERAEVEIHVIQFPNGKDPDESVRASKIEFKKAIEKPMPVYDFIFYLIEKKYEGGDAFSKKKAADEIAPYLSEIKNPIVKSHYMRRLAAFLDVSEDSVDTLLKKIKFGKIEKKTPNTSQTEENSSRLMDRHTLMQKHFLSLLFQSADIYALVSRLFPPLTPSSFTIPAWEKIVEILLSAQASSNGQPFDVNEFIKSLPNQLRVVFDELYLFGTSSEAPQIHDIMRLAFEIQRHYLKEQISALMKVGDVDKSQELLLSTLILKLKEVEKEMSS